MSLTLKPQAPTTCTWYVQANMRQDNDGVDALVQALGATGTPYQEVNVRPFTDELAGVDVRNPCVFYGSTTLRDQVLLASLMGEFRPGLFYEPRRFEWEAVYRGWGGWMLNADAHVTDVVDFFASVANLPPGENEPIFLRPYGDTKAAVGAVRTPREWDALIRDSLNVRGGFRHRDRVLVATPKAIATEYRFWVVGGRIVTGCTVRQEGRLALAPLPEDPELLLWAAHRAHEYEPAPVYVLDVCRLESGGLRVVEPNTANCAGLYVMDARAIVEAVNAYVLAHY